MRKLTQKIEKILPSVKDGLFPTAFFGIATVCFFLSAPFSTTTLTIAHSLFYTVALGIFMALLYFNRSKPIFFTFCIVISYILINHLKINLGEQYLLSAEYQNLCLFLPINLLLFYFLPNQRLSSNKNGILLLSLFLEYAIVEQLSKQGINLNLLTDRNYGITGMAFIISVAVLITLFIHVTLSGKNRFYGLFFAYLNIFLGLFYSSSASGLSLFFSTGICTLLLTTCLDIYSQIYKDELTHLDGRNAYIAHTKKLPHKYCVGIICIDDYDKLSSIGSKNRNLITQMITERIVELEKEAHIYRYASDEFILIFNNLDKKESFARLEEIRRGIASVLFQYNKRRKALKLTISASVSEKKRSDANSYEVLLRAEKILQKTKTFSQNVTSQA